LKEFTTGCIAVGLIKQNIQLTSRIEFVDLFSPVEVGTTPDGVV
jgi:hypothetical protein